MGIGNVIVGGSISREDYKAYIKWGEYLYGKCCRICGIKVQDFKNKVRTRNGKVCKLPRGNVCGYMCRKGLFVHDKDPVVYPDMCNKFFCPDGVWCWACALDRNEERTEKDEKEAGECTTSERPKRGRATRSRV